MNRRARIGQKTAELYQAVQQTIAFLRMAAVQARHIADDSPDVAVLLRVLADKLDAEADDLARLAQATD